MKKSILTIALTVLTLVMTAQTKKITGSWMMTKVETKSDGVQEPYFVTDFNADGTMVVMGMPVGTWKYDKQKNAIVASSKMDKDFNGESKIEKLSKKEMIVLKDGNRFYYSKVNMDDVAANNSQSNLTGLWRAESDEYGNVFLRFKEPDTLVIVLTGDGSVETSKSSWMYNPKDKIVVVMGFSHLLRGKVDIKELTDDKLVLDKGGSLINASKVDENAVKINELTFVYDDFPEEYGDDDQLPWRDFEYMIDYLKDVKKIVYHHGSLLADVNAFEYSTYYSEIKVDEEKPSVIFTNFVVENGTPAQYSEKYKGGLSGMYNYFFPLDELAPYRIAGKETVTVPAGTFKCTVIEGLDGDTKIKLWMIDDKPGIYAKKVRQGDNFGTMSYTVDELESIE